jgi:hypothetical protein
MALFSDLFPLLILGFLFHCLLAYLPLLANSLSLKNRNLLLTVGIGSIIGIIFVSIIPQGINTTYNIQALSAQLLSATPSSTPLHRALLATDDAALDDALSKYKKNEPGMGQNSAKNANNGPGRPNQDGSAVESAEFCSNNSLSGYIGAALSLGFVLMIILDRILLAPLNNSAAEANYSAVTTSPRNAAEFSDLESENEARALLSSTNSPSTQGKSPNNNLGERQSSKNTAAHANHGTSSINNFHLSNISIANSGSEPSERSRIERSKEIERNYSNLNEIHNNSNVYTVSMGVFIHCAAEGIATALQLEKFHSNINGYLLYLLSRSPLLLGLVSLLFFQQRPFKQIRNVILAYILIIPIAAILINIVIESSSGAAFLAKNSSLLGLIFLFTSGCIIFTISVYILPELTNENNPNSNLYSHSTAPEESEKSLGSLDWPNLSCLMLGMILPLMLNSINRL